MARRVVRIRLDPRMSRPESRQDIKRPDEELLNWVYRERGAIVSAVLTMVKAWIVAGRPAAEVPAFGSFNSCAKTVGGILAFAEVPGFLSNTNQVYEEADEESAEWEAFLRLWVFKFGALPTYASEIGSWLAALDWVALPEAMGELRSPSETSGSRNKRIASILRRKVGARHGDRELRIEKEKDTRTGIAMWRVAGNLEGLRPGDLATDPVEE
jgi:hypothetical protein